MKGNDERKNNKNTFTKIKRIFQRYWFGLALIGLGIMWNQKVRHIKKHGQYGVATTQYKSSSWKHERVYFEFRAENGKLYQGTYSQIGKNTPKVKCPNGKYLVIYSTKNPTINVLVDNKEFNSQINLDSLKLAEIDSNDWTWKEL